MAHLIHLCSTFLFVLISIVKCTHLCTQITSGDYSQINSITFADATEVNIFVSNESSQPFVYKVPVSLISPTSMDITKATLISWKYYPYFNFLPENEHIEAVYSSMFLKSSFLGLNNVVKKQTLAMTNAMEYYFYDDFNPDEDMVKRHRRRPFSIAHEQLELQRSVFGYVFGKLFSSLQISNIVFHIARHCSNIQSRCFYRLSARMELKSNSPRKNERFLLH